MIPTAASTEASHAPQSGAVMSDERAPRHHPAPLGRARPAVVGRLADGRAARTSVPGTSERVEDPIAEFVAASATVSPGMVSSMATKKVTVTLDEAQLDRIRALVASAATSSVSGFVQHAVGVALDDVAGWGAQLAEALRETGGPLSDDERAWADQILRAGKRRKRSAA